MANPRRQRKEEFLGSEAMPSSFSVQLILSANALLAIALHERRQGVVKTATNHFTHHAAGALALILTAFDAWVTQTLALSTWHGGEDLKEGLADLPLCARYQRLAEVSGVTVPEEVRGDLALLVEVRHEIIHHLPRPVSSEGNVPACLVELHRRELFIATGRSYDYPFPDKLGSYKLAYWAFRTVAAAASTWTDGARREWEWQFGMARNFLLYVQESCPPEVLPTFDTRYGIQLTVWEDEP